MTKHQDSKNKERVLTWKEESKMWQDAAGVDIIRHLCSISKEEYNYYNNVSYNQNKKVT